MMDASLKIRTFRGSDIKPYLADIARLRIEVFREFPYLYDGSQEYEEKYLSTYIDSPESIAVLVFDNDAIVGASTALPLADETEEFRRPFLREGIDPDSVFYCGESILRKAWRGHGIYPEFFRLREEAAYSGSFDLISFCAVDRPDNHPLKPHDYRPLDPVWQKFGYTRHPELHTTYRWKDLGDEEESDKPMIFWLKPLTETVGN
jgi:hypothetical protein